MFLNSLEVIWQVCMKGEGGEIEIVASGTRACKHEKVKTAKLIFCLGGVTPQEFDAFHGLILLEELARTGKKVVNISFKF